MSTISGRIQILGIAISCTMAFSVNSAVAEIVEDSTLPNNSQVTQQGSLTIINGGTRSQDGRNLFHSFREFSIPENYTAEFINTDNVHNIISRVTGNSISQINGTLKAGGIANLFLINPNGIIFGPKASLQINGSFVASTASSVNFDDGTKFSATDPKTTSLLTVSVPIGLQFGSTVAFIRNQSQATANNASSSVGLQVQPGKTLALVGGDITLEGGKLTAESGHIELGSVAENSLVSLKPMNEGWVFGYEAVQKFQNIQLLLRRNFDGSEIASEVIARTKDGSGGSIQVQGNNVELTGGFVRLTTQTTGVGNGGDLTINARKLIVRDGAQVTTATIGEGNGGKLTVNASESVEVSGSSLYPGSTNERFPSVLFSTTSAAGNAGDITINTGKLRILNRGQVATNTLAFSHDSNLIASTGAGGHLTVNASSIELIGTSEYATTGLFASTRTFGDAGKVTIATEQLIIRNGAEVTVSSLIDPNYVYPGDIRNLGKAGELNITAGSILLDNQGKLASNSDLGRGGNISLQVRDLLLLRRNSQITTNAGTAGTGGDGGNITINAPNGFIVAVPKENSDITANAYTGNGGNINLIVKAIYGIQPRQFNTPESDITASSRFGSNGVININTPDADPRKGLEELPTTPVNASQRIVAGCNSGGKLARNSFTTTGRGGITPSPLESLTGDAVLADWITLKPESENLAGSSHNRVVAQTQQSKPDNTQNSKSVNNYSEIVEAQGWVIDANGKVVLVAQAPIATPHSPALSPTSCPANGG